MADEGGVPDQAKFIKKLDDYLAEIPKANLNTKANVMGKEIVTFLSQHTEAIDVYENIGNFADALGAHFILAPNPKVREFI